MKKQVQRLFLFKKVSKKLLRDSLRKAVTQQWLQEAELINAQEGTRNEDQQSNSL